MQNIALTLLERKKKTCVRVFQMKDLLWQFLYSTDFKIKLIISSIAAECNRAAVLNNTV